MFVFDNFNKTFLVGGFILFTAGLVMAYLRAPRHDLESTLFWVFLVATFAVLFWCFGVADEERYVRYFAVAFTIAVIVAAFYPLMDARATLQKPGVIESLRAWIAQPFKFDQQVVQAVTGAGDMKATAGSVTAVGATLTTHPKSLPPEERITLLETQVAALEAKQAQEAAAMRRDARNAEAAAQQQYETQVYAANQLRQLIEELQTGGLAVIVWGLFWLGIGGTLGGLTPEVVDLVKWLHK